jgi:hypothetical protein
MEKEDEEKKIYPLVGRSLGNSEENKLVFISRAIPLVEPLAHHFREVTIARHKLVQQVTLLLDFDSEEIEWLN